jgi:hypothetical protein
MPICITNDLFGKFIVTEIHKPIIYMEKIRFNKAPYV